MKKLLLAVCALFGFIACTQNPIEEQSAIRTDVPETIKVGFEDSETRIQLNEAQKTVWTKDDLVSVFYKSDANQMWEYRGETGERVADLYRVDAGTASSKMSYVVLVYPYSTDYVLSTASGNIETTLPATQHYATDSYAVGENLMVSRSEFTQFSLKSVCGWLKLQLTGNGEVVKSIKFRGNNNEQVAGLIYVDTATAEATLASEMGGSDGNNAGGNLVFDDTILTEVVLDCGEGVTLGAEATAFYISLPPQTFENGFTVVVECDGYKPMTLSTSNALTIERNTIQPMASVECDATPNIPYDEIWYTNGGTTTATEPHDASVFGVNIISNTYDANKECWVIKFDGDVTTIGWEAFYKCSSLISVTIPESVTKIGYYAFRECSSLTSVTIPDSVTTIGSYAFRSCSSLTKFNGKFASEDGRCLIIDGTLNSFAPAGLIEYTIPNCVTTIGDYAFSGCSSLTSITIPDSVTKIGYDAFEYCSSLTSVTIPDSVTTIGSYAFWRCSSLTSVTIGDSVTSIGYYAFRECSSLIAFKGKYASEDGRCLIVDGVLNSFAPAGLTEYTIPDSVTTIEDYAFFSCRSLTSVTIPDSVTTIGDYAFDGCRSLTSVTIGCNVATIGNNAFYDCNSLISLTIPNSVKSIGNYAFYYCDKISSLTLSDGLTHIGAHAFQFCDSLTEVTIPDSVTTIDVYGFEYCKNLSRVTLGKGLATIGSYSFYNCDKLTNIYCKSTTPPDVYYTSILSVEVPDRKIYVPTESVEAYKSASYWRNYASEIEGYNF